jgi:hypothetical protein
MILLPGHRERHVRLQPSAPAGAFAGKHLWQRSAPLLQKSVAKLHKRRINVVDVHLAVARVTMRANLALAMPPRGHLATDGAAHGGKQQMLLPGLLRRQIAALALDAVPPADGIPSDRRAKGGLQQRCAGACLRRDAQRGDARTVRQAKAPARVMVQRVEQLFKSRLAGDGRGAIQM